MFGNDSLSQGVVATACWRVQSPLLFPVRCDAGEYLAVLPGTENLRVVDRTARHVVRRGSFPEGKLWSVLADMEEAGVIRFLYGLPIHHLHRLPSLDEGPPPPLQLMR